MRTDSVGRTPLEPEPPPSSTVRNRLRLATVLIVLVAFTAVGCGNATSPASGTARIVSTHQVKGRIWDVTVRSPAIGSDVHVRLLLPRRFKSAPDRRWPVLYLLHGCCDSYVSWTRSTDIARLSTNLDALVVMPDGGRAGFYSDWSSGPHWETFHLQELTGLLEKTYRASDRRVIAGVSMGGLGALDYAARHPGMFTVAASFSGVVDTRLSPGVSQAYLSLVESQGEDPYALWGDPDGDVDVWRAHNPYDLAARLAGTRLYISAGSGQPGPLDSAGTTRDQTETDIRAQNEAFAKRVRALHLDARIDLYSPGTHNWVYWQRELHKAWPLLTEGLGDS